MAQQTLTDFEPSENQRQFLKAMQASDYALPIGEACKAAGLASRQSFYDWSKDGRFIAWWAEQAERWFGMQLPRVQAAMLRAASGAELSGSPDRKLFLERYDRKYTPRTKQDVELKGQVPIILKVGPATWFEATQETQEPAEGEHDDGNA